MREGVTAPGSPSAVAPADEAVRTSEPPRLHPVRRLRELFAVRELLGNLVRKEVRVKYASSALGAVWSMLNPVLYLAVFSLVFNFALKANIPDYAVYLLSGLLAWNLFATSLGLASRAVVDNANLVTKVYFPREILPLASIGAAGVDFLLQLLVLVVFMAALTYPFFGWNLLLFPLSLTALLAFTAALALWVAALNVRYRDTQHLLNIALTLWLWLTPVIYPSGSIWDKLEAFHLHWVKYLFLANPMAGIEMGFQRALYAHPAVSVPAKDDSGRVVGHTIVHVLPTVSVPWLALLIGCILVGSLGLLLLAWRTFFHMAADFAEDL
jgi:ABC-2 type transport system permease protein